MVITPDLGYVGRRMPRGISARWQDFVRQKKEEFTGASSFWEKLLKSLSPLPEWHCTFFACRRCQAQFLGTVVECQGGAEPLPEAPETHNQSEWAIPG